MSDHETRDNITLSKRAILATIVTNPAVGFTLLTLGGMKGRRTRELRRRRIDSAGGLTDLSTALEEFGAPVITAEGHLDFSAVGTSLMPSLVADSAAIPPNEDETADHTNQEQVNIAVVSEQVPLRRSVSSEIVLEPQSLIPVTDLQQLLSSLGVSQAYGANVASGQARQHLGNIYNVTTNVNINTLTIGRRHSEESFVTARMEV